MGSLTPPSIPVVDVGALFTSSRDSSGYRAAATKLRQACSVNGGVGITGHGISPDFVRKAFQVNQKFFALPYAEKMKAPHPEGLYPHRGYSGPGKEALANSAAVKTQDEALKEELGSTLDHKETYEIGNDANRVNYNIWLPEEVLPGFKDFTTDLYWKLTEFTTVLIDALALGAGFTDKERQYAVGLHTGLDSAIRLLHYPAGRLTGLGGNGGRLGAHTDWGLFTILLQDTVGGLEFQDLASREWMSAEPQGDVIYLNIADMFSRITNAASSQTTEQKQSGEVPERHAIAYFVAPDPDALIYAQASRIIADGCMRYEPVVFQTYSEALFRASQTGRDTGEAK